MILYLVPPFPIILLVLGFVFESRGAKRRSGVIESRWAFVARGLAQGAVAVCSGLWSPFELGIAWGLEFGKGPMSTYPLPDWVGSVGIVLAFWLTVSVCRLLLEQTCRLPIRKTEPRPRLLSFKEIATLSLPDVLVCMMVTVWALYLDSGPRFDRGPSQVSTLASDVKPHRLGHARAVYARHAWRRVALWRHGHTTPARRCASAPGARQENGSSPIRVGCDRRAGVACSGCETPMTPRSVTYVSSGRGVGCEHGSCGSRGPVPDHSRTCDARRMGETCGTRPRIPWFAATSP